MPAVFCTAFNLLIILEVPTLSTVCALGCVHIITLIGSARIAMSSILLTYLISSNLTSSLSPIINRGQTTPSTHTAGWMSDSGIGCEV